MKLGTANAIINKRFSSGSTPRSAAFKHGFATGLMKTPDRESYQPGSAEFDAYWAGYEDARNSMKTYLELVAKESEQEG